MVTHNNPQDVEIAKPSDILNASTVPSRLAIINFDDGFQNLGVDYESLPYGKILHRLVNLRMP